MLEYIDHPHQRSDDFLEDFCDGEVFKNHPLFSTDPHALQIIAYSNELEVCNPLGTHTKTHKLLIILFTLGNIPPKYRSTLKAIYLVACAVRPVVDRHGLDSVLEPFVKDLTILTSHRNLKGGLLCLSGRQCCEQFIRWV